MIRTEIKPRFSRLAAQKGLLVLVLAALPLSLFGQSGLLKPVREAEGGAHVNGYYNLTDSQDSDATIAGLGGIRINYSSLTHEAAHAVLFRVNGGGWNFASAIHVDGSASVNTSGLVTTGTGVFVVEVEITQAQLIAGPYNLTAGDVIEFGLDHVGVTNSPTFIATVTGGGNELTYDIAPPTISSVTSSDGDGTYKDGDAINITVTFSESSTLSSGSLRTTLNTGYNVDVGAATWSNTASGTYTVQTDDATGDLDNSSVSITAGAITDAAGNTLTSFTPASDLSTSSNIVVDGVHPTISSVTSITSDGYIGIGGDIDFSVNFSEATTVAGGNLRITFETGAVDRSVDITGATYSNTASSTYTVQTSDVSADLATSSISITAGTITDGAGNALTDFTPASVLSSTSSLVVDGIRPLINSVSSTTANGTYGVGDPVLVTLNFSETVSVSGGNLEVTLETGATDRIAYVTPFSLAGSGTGTYTVQLNDVSGDLAVSSIADPGNALTDRAGNTITDLTIQGNNISDTKALVVDGVLPTVSSLTSLSADGNYGIGDDITLQITMSEPVTLFTGNLVFTLETGVGDATATISTITNSSTAVGTYTVLEGEVSSDLTANSVGLSTGTLEDAGGNDVSDYTIPGGNNIADSKAIVVDGVRPTITGISSATADGTYAITDNILVTLTFSEPVTTAGGGSIVVEMETGTVDTQITISGLSSDLTGTATLVVNDGFTSSDLNVNSVSMPVGTLEDDFGNAMTVFTIPGGQNLADSKALVVDGIRPTVSSVSASTANGKFNTGDAIDVTITFDQAVTVVGTPQLNLDLGGGYLVDYTSGTTTTVLTFQYTVIAGQNTTDLEYLDVSSLSAGTSIKDASGNDATLTLPTIGAGNSLGDNRNLLIDTDAPAAVSATSSTANGSYTTGGSIAVQVTFDQIVIVSGTPTIDLDLGGAWPVNYTSGAGTTELTFTYTVQAGQTSSDLAYLTTTPLSGTITDSAGNAAAVILPNPGDPSSLSGTKSLIIDTTPPTITDVTSPDADGYYLAGDSVDLEITFTETIFVTGTPQLTLETGTSDAVADYVSGTGSDTWTFRYYVLTGHIASDLDYVATTSLNPNLGTLQDLAGNDATLTLPALAGGNSIADSKDINVDAVVPTVTLVSANFADGIYPAGTLIPITVAFDEIVAVGLGGGTPDITLDVDGGYAVAYTSGSASDTLKFNYTVLADHDTTDLAYVSATSLALNSATIRDIAGNDADITLDTPSGAASLSGMKAIAIDTQTPAVTLVTTNEADGPYMAGDVIPIKIVFDENVTVTGGPPDLVLETGTVNQSVAMSSGSGTDTLTFNYTVQAGDSSLDLDYITGTPVILNAATISDVAGNLVSPVTLPTAGDTSSLSDGHAVVIDTRSPTILEVTAADTNGYYKAGSVIALQVIFTENVTVGGGPPQLTLETGSTDAIVDYTSGSSNDTLLFSYTVASDENSTDLDYVTTTSLTLNGGTIADSAGNTATLTLAAPAGSGSLGDSKAIIIDTTPPVVTFTYSDTLGIAGDTVVVTATASEDLLAAPDITLTYNPVLQGPFTTDSTSVTVYTYDAIIPADNNGLLTLSLSGTDLAGNAIVDSNLVDPAKLLVDNTPPGYVVAYSDSLVKKAEVVDITVTYDDVLSGTPTISIDYAGTGSDIVDTALTNIGQDTVWTFEITIPDGNDGYVTLTSTATDIAGNTVVHTSGGTNTLLLDNIAPTVSATSPADSAFVNDLDITYSLGETLDSGWVVWTFLNTSGITDNSSPHSQNLDSSEIVLGAHPGTIANPPALIQGAEYDIAFIAQDAAGNADTATVSAITYDTLAPVITGVEIIDGAGTADLDSTAVRLEYSLSFSGFVEDFTGIPLYEYSLGSTAGDSDVVAWTSTGTDTTATATSLTLGYKSWYYPTVRATDGAGNRTAYTTGDGVRIIDRPRVTLSVVQNSAITNYLQVLATDTLAMANSMTLTIDGTAATLIEIDSFTYALSHKLDTSGTVSFIATGTNAFGDSAATADVEIDFARAASPWTIFSVDANFQVSAPRGAVLADQLLAIAGGTGGNFVSDAPLPQYMLGHGGLIFEQPVQVKLRSSLTGQNGGTQKWDKGGAVYQLSQSGEWIELPSMEENGAVVAWTRRGGMFRLGERTLVMPEKTTLSANYPNPFNPSTRIAFDLGLLDGPEQRVSLIVYNLLGQQVKVLVSGVLQAGHHQVVWNGSDRRNQAVASGIYFVRLQTASGHHFTHKMALLK